MQKKRVIFFPMEIGIAHVSRCLAIAEELHKSGYKVYVALPRRKHSTFANTPITFIDIHGVTDIESIEAITTFKDVNKVVEFIEEEKEIMKKYKIDICVVDFRFSCLVSSSQLNIPIFYYTGSGGLPFGCYIPNPGLMPMLYPVFEPIMHVLLLQMKLQFFEILEEASEKTGLKVDLKKILNSINYIVPEFPGYLPSLKKKLKIHYSGPLSWQGFNNKKPSWLKKIHPNGKTIYLTFGGTGFDKEKLISLATTLLAKGYRVIVSTSSIANPEDFPTHRNLFVERYLPGDEIAERVDLVVCHGGYGTITQATMAGKPVVTVPFNPDQLLHSLRYEELGLGVCTADFKVKHFISIINANWIKFESIGRAIPPEKVIDAVDEVLANIKVYDRNIRKIRSRLVKQTKNCNFEKIFS